MQLLSSADEVALFLLSLGYNVDARVEQTPISIGISTESLMRQIKHIERIASQEDELQVCLFEMTSRQVTDWRGSAHTFAK